MVDVRLVGYGVDTLVLNVSYADAALQPIKQELADDLQQELEALQKEAREVEEAIPTRWAFEGMALYMQPKGSRGPWRWVLRSPLLSLAISRGRLNRIIAQVRLSSEYLWSCETVAHAIVHVSVFLRQFFGKHLWLQVSAVDLCADVVGWDVARCDWQTGFVSRAIGETVRPADEASEGPCVARRRWKAIATLDFGKHRSPISCCIYHKTAEIRQQSPTKVWFHDLWRRYGWNGVDAVWRVEFRMTREFLHAVKLEEAYDLPALLPLLWQYCAGQVGGGADGLPDGWLRYVVPVEDPNRSRWPVHPAWAVVQHAFESESDGIGGLVRERIREANIERGVASVVGYLSTLSAWVGGDLLADEVEMSGVLHWLYGASGKYLAKKEMEFAKLVQKKAKLYRSEDERVS